MDADGQGLMQEESDTLCRKQSPVYLSSSFWVALRAWITEWLKFDQVSTTGAILARENPRCSSCVVTDPSPNQSPHWINAIYSTVCPFFVSGCPTERSGYPPPPVWFVSVTGRVERKLAGKRFVDVVCIL